MEGGGWREMLIHGGVLGNLHLIQTRFYTLCSPYDPRHQSPSHGIMKTIVLDTQACGKYITLPRPESKHPSHLSQF